MKYHIYLVDGDKFHLDLYTAKFKSAGHDVSVFISCEDLLLALRKSDAVLPDAILLGLVMPGMGGFKALEEIRKEHLAKDAKIIILSSQSDDSDIKRAKSLDVDGYIIKASAVPSEVLKETMNIIKHEANNTTNN